jgi:rod shape-determining protein MreD
VSRVSVARPIRHEGGFLKTGEAGKSMMWGSAVLSKVRTGILVLFSLVLFQSLLSGVVTIAGIKLDLAILILVYLSLTRGRHYGMVFGFLIGFLFDIFTPGTLGLGALVKCLIGFTLGSFKDNLYLESSYSKGAVVFLTLILNDSLYYTITTGLSDSTFRVLTRYSLPSALYTSVIGMLIFLVVARIHQERVDAQKRSVQIE